MISHDGELKIGDIILPCYVTNDGKRVLSGRALQIALNLTGEERGAPGDRVDRLLAHKTLSPLIIKDKPVAQFEPIKCRFKDNVRKPINGYSAEVMADICEGMLEARRQGLLTTERHQQVAAQCEILLRGFARVGLIALIDEATGYQKDRAKDALAQILEKFVAKELQPWLKTFPSDYYEQLFRLYGLPFPPERANARPSFFGRITNNVVYERLAPDLLPELKKAASKAERKAHLHRWLTSDIGHPKLREHLSSIITLLKLARTPQEFRDMVDRIHPPFGTTIPMDFGNLPDS